jgi:hypothetical protein
MHFTKTKQTNSFIMLSIESIQKDFSYIKAWTGDSEVFQNSEEFPGHGEFCDVYFQTFNKQIYKEQVERYNNFKSDYKAYIPDIEKGIEKCLTSPELAIRDKIAKSTLFFDVIFIPQGKIHYDLVLICSKTFKKNLFIKNEIAIRIEFLLFSALQHPKNISL